jgi:adenylate kinase
METKLYFVLGGPASGKSTLCKKIIHENPGVIHISVGELLKNEIGKGMEVGQTIYDYIKAAKIVPDNITFDILMKELSKHDGKTILVDGYPRDTKNNDYFKTHKPMSMIVQKILFLDCHDHVMMERVIYRNGNRFDDDIEIMKQRINMFRTQTMNVVHIDCIKTPNEIYDSIQYMFTK